MTVVIFNSENAEKIINHFVAYGFDSFIVFSPGATKIDRNYYKINGIKVVEIKSFVKEGTDAMLTKIRGSLKNRFFAVYSDRIIDFSLDEVLTHHLLGQRAVTLIQSDKRLVSSIMEEEIFDYMCKKGDFEKDVLAKVGQDGELGIYE